jgi:hypothetical protein
MRGQLMHSTKMLHVGQIRAEKMALARIYKRVSYIPLLLSLLLDVMGSQTTYTRAHTNT